MSLGILALSSAKLFTGESWLIKLSMEFLTLVKKSISTLAVSLSMLFFTSLRFRFWGYWVDF